MKYIPLFKVYMSQKASGYVKEVLNSGYIGQGQKVEEFENRLQKLFNFDYILTTNSGTSAEHLALHLLKNATYLKNSKSSLPNWPGLNPRDEILAPSLTCLATNAPILMNDFRIKWIDVDPNTMNVDLDDIARKITSKTKLIIVVHWGGYPVDLNKLDRICEKAKDMYGFKPIVIEDCAHAFGSKYQDKWIGTHGNICFFSFQAIKTLTCIDGGALFVPDYNLYKQGKLSRWYGIDRESDRRDFRCESDVPLIGTKFHMNDVCAAVGLANLEEVFTALNIQQDNSAFYDASLQDMDGITLLENHPDHTSACWLYTMKVKDRDNFMKKMNNDGIVVSRVHERNDKHSCMQEFKTQLPNLDKVIQEQICIPVGWWVSPKDREYIVTKIKEGW